MLNTECTLIILNGSEPIREINLNSTHKKRISFGRDDTNDISINSPIMSRVHGYIEEIDGELYIYDNSSTNGFYVNDIFYGIEETGEAKMHLLVDGDIIRVDEFEEQRNLSDGVMILFTQRKNEGCWKEFALIRDGVYSIGRERDNDIQFESVGVSRKHSFVRKEGNEIYISDNKSTNGTFVNGELITNETKLEIRDVIYIANTILIYTGTALIYKAKVTGTQVLMKGINRTVKTKNGLKKILNNVNLQIEPGDFVAIIGGSGSGKTTIMNAMSGYEMATSGTVYVNSVNLYKHYKVLKNILGYVPQQDIIYENLTLDKMLEYSARLRMADDVSSSEIKERINEVLEMVELTEHRSKKIRSLSGGQKKRASIAVELLGDPGLFFLDEPTSGLDPGTEESLMKSLRRLSKQNGKTVIMVTHTTQNLHLCDKIILMGTNGHICFYGTVPECLATFNVENLTEVYNKVTKETDVARWSGEYYRKYGIHLGFSETKEGRIPKQKKENLFKQLRILTLRYMELIRNDIQRLIMILAQPILIGLLLAFVASDDVFEIYNGTKSILFALSCAGIWIGLFNSIQEICKERIILKREYMANLRLDAYISSKFIVQMLISIIQALLLVIVFTLTVGEPEGVLFSNPFAELTFTLFLTIFSSAGLGLVVSAVSKNSDKAMTVAPFLLIIQLLFSGILFELSNFTEKISYLTISKWSVAALGISSNLNNLLSLGGIQREIEEIFEFTKINLYKTWIVLASFVILCAIISGVLLKNISKDSR